MVLPGFSQVRPYIGFGYRLDFDYYDIPKIYDPLLNRRPNLKIWDSNYTPKCKEDDKIVYHSKRLKSNAFFAQDNALFVPKAVP